MEKNNEDEDFIIISDSDDYNERSENNPVSITEND